MTIRTRVRRLEAMRHADDSDLTPAERETLDRYRATHGLENLRTVPVDILGLVVRDGPCPPVPWSEMSTAQLEALAEGATFPEVLG